VSYCLLYVYRRSTNFRSLNSGSDIRHVLITTQVVRGEASPGYWRKGEGVAFWEAWATQEAEGNKQ
jgi:hypothetical protein